MILKRLTAAFLLAAMLLSLTACGTAGSEPTDEQDKEKLLSLLDDIGENVRPGTTGSGLTAIRIAADLVSWAASTNMTKSQAAGIVGSWLKEQSPEIREAFREKVSQVAEAYGKIAREEAKDLLESAGVQETVSDLSSRLKDMVEAILDAAK